MTFLVNKYAPSAASGVKYRMCDECAYPAAWRIDHQISTDRLRTGYSCSEHVDTVLVKIDKGLPGGDSPSPAS